MTNKKRAVEPPDSNYYTPMVGVGKQDIDLTNLNSQYENRPGSGHIKTGKSSMGKK